MWPKADSVERPFDGALLAQLETAGVAYRRLLAAEHQTLESAWRQSYQRAFVRGERFQHGAKAVHAFLGEWPDSWLFVPFLSAVPGTSVTVVRLTASAFECCGPLLELGDFINVEFFISPPDLSWTFVRTHEDFVLGGPYFARNDPAR